jgi:putative inorganic carbon (hco3(-)) transporter
LVNGLAATENISRQREVVLRDLLFAGIFGILGMATIGVGLILPSGLVQTTITLAVIVPAVALALAESPALVSYVVGVWAFAPGLRRYLDYQTGSFQAVSLISALPLLVSLTFLIAIAKRPIVQASRVYGSLLVFSVILLSSFVYGIIHNGSAALYDFLSYLAPLLSVLYFAARRPSESQCDAIIRQVVMVGIVVSFYGWYQYIFMDPWDKLWMTHSGGMPSIGEPRPFEVRVFSTLNSPGSLSSFLCLTVVLSILDRRWRGLLGLPGTLMLVSCFGLTMVRSEWFVGGLMILAYIIATPSKARVRFLIRILAFVAVVGALVPFIPGSSKIVQRVMTINALGSDHSLRARAAFSAGIASQVAVKPFGLGLGSTGVGTRLSTGNGNLGELAIFDNGYLSLVFTFGVIGAGAIVIIIIGFAIMSLTSAGHLGSAGRFARLGHASMIGGLGLLPFSNCFTGIIGLCVWLPVGMWVGCLGRSILQRKEEQAARIA